MSVRGFTFGIDWSGNGDYAGTQEDVTSRVLDSPTLHVTYGRDTAQTQSPMATGKLSAGLRNDDRVLSPENTSSPIAGLVLPGRKARLTKTGPTALVGINISGGEFGTGSLVGGGTFSNSTPGVYDTDYHYESSASLTYLASRGLTVVRIPFRWERIQPTLGAALNAAELARLQAVVNRAGAAGLAVILDVHNMAQYVTSGGTLTLGSASLTQAHFTDLWTRLTAAFKTYAHVCAYELMNEPHDMPNGAFTAATTRHTWDSTTESWAGEGATTVARVTTPTHDGAGALSATKTLGAGTDSLRFNDGAGLRDISASGPTLAVWALVPSGAPGTGWQARLELQDSAFSWQAGPSTNMTPGTWAQLTYSPSAALLANCRAIGVQFSATGASASATVYIDTLRQGSQVTGTGQWETISQAAVNAIRTEEGATGPRLILVDGHGWSGAWQWTTSHPDPWIDDPGGNLAYAPHVYHDNDHGGSYASSYSTENTNAIGQGYTSVTARSLARVATFTDWAQAYGVRGYFTESGWPDTADWNTLGAAVLAALAAAGMPLTYWSTGEWWPDTDQLIAYEATGANLDTANGQAAVLEAKTTAQTILFEGELDDIPDIATDAPAKDFTVNCLDAWGRPGAEKLSTPLYRGLRTGDAITVILDAIGWPADRRDIDTGATILRYWWVEGDDAATAVEHLIDAEGPPAAAYVEGGTFVFRDRHHRTLAWRSRAVQAFYSHAVPEGSRLGTMRISPGAGYSHGLRNIVNTVAATVAERRQADLGQVWSTDDRYALADGETIEIAAQPGDPFVGAVAPVDGTDFTTATGAVEVWLSRDSGQATTIYVKAVGGPAVISGMALRAQALVVARTHKVFAEDVVSVGRPGGRRAWPKEIPWAGVNDAHAIASRIVSMYGTSQPTVVFSVAAAPSLPDVHLADILGRRVSDRVRYINDELGFNADVHVERVEHDIVKLGGIHTLTLGCQVAPAVATDALILGSATRGVLGTNKLGRQGLEDPDTVFVIGSAARGVLGTNLVGA